MTGQSEVRDLVHSAMLFRNNMLDVMLEMTRILR
jgi:hypothetical protein